MEVLFLAWKVYVELAERLRLAGVVPQNLPYRVARVATPYNVTDVLKSLGYPAENHIVTFICAHLSRYGG